MKFSQNFLTVGVLSLFLLASIGFVAAAESSTASAPKIPSEALFDVNPGILPDSPFYFIDQLLEFNADDPENALAYKQEKIAEALAMAEEKKTAEARKALQGASGYGNTLEKEITPEMEKGIPRDSAAAKEALTKISQDLPELEEDVTELMAKEDRIKLAAQVSSKIKKLCETLAKLDPKQYAENCKVAEDSPQWQKDLDEELTGEQKQQAQTFVGKLRQCAKTNGRECDCEGMGIQ